MNNSNCGAKRGACQFIVVVSFSFLTLAAFSIPAHAGCTTVAPGIITCTGVFNGSGISESSNTDISLTADAATQVTTSAAKAYAIRVESIGDNGSNGHNESFFHPTPTAGGAGHPSGNVSVSSAATINTSGEDAIGIFGLARAGNGGKGGDGGVLFGGRSGGVGGDNSNRTVSLENSGSIITQGKTAIGIVSQNHGGTGGRGGSGGIFAGGAGGGGGGHAGTVTIINDGLIVTNGSHAHGMFLHSVGGFGGDGGGSIGFVGFGGSGGSAGNGGNVDATNKNTITTIGNFANGIYAQSVGGGGGRGGDGIGIVGLGGFGGIGGNGNSVSVTNRSASNNPDDAKITTHGKDSIGIFAQSVGGSGGDGGDSGGIVAIGGDAKEGGAGGAVTVDNAGTINTAGNGAFALYAQSIGGGGGHGGSSGGVVSIGGTGGDGGNGGTVRVDNDTNSFISTTGSDAGGIFAQSVGGGGGNGGSSVAVGLAFSLAIGGNGAKGGAGNSVNVVDCSTNAGGNCLPAQNGQINTIGDRSHGIHAQSIGGGGGRGGYGIAASAGPDFSFSVALGGSGAGGGNGAAVDVLSNSIITTTGSHSYGIAAESIGGGGGSGGFSIAGTISDGPSGSVALGGSAGTGGSGGATSVETFGTIGTTGQSSHAIFAQSVGGGGGHGGFAVAGSIGTGVSAAFAIGGSGANGGAGGTVDVKTHGAITTADILSNAIHAQSVGGGGGHGGFAIGAAVTSGAAGLSLGIGGKGAGGGNGAAVTVTSDNSAGTTGDSSHAIFAQSVGGGGGSGGFSGAFSMSLDSGSDVGVSIGGAGGTASSGGIVSVTQDGASSTVGDYAAAIVAQSIGGGGGHGGFGLSASLSTGSDPNLSVAIGGTGGGGGDGDTVDVVTGGIVTTSGKRSHGIQAQSIGGGGGNGGFSFAGTLSTSTGSKDISVSIGGSGGNGGDGKKVSVNSGANVTTNASDAIGIFAQSIGGGGGEGGLALSGAFSGDKSRNLTFSLGGSGGGGARASDVTVVSDGLITTGGDRAFGIFAHSIGGGGGTGAMAVDLDITKGGNTTQLNVAIGGNGGNGGTAGSVTVNANGGVSTTGEEAVGILAQSIGGGGGRGGFAASIGVTTKASDPGKAVTLGVSVGGNGGTGGLSESVTVNTDGLISTSGISAHGIQAQSIGGGGGTGGSAHTLAFFLKAGSTGESDGSQDNKSLSVSVGGNAGSGNNAGTVTVNNQADILTTNADAYGIFAQSIGGGGGEGGHGSHGLPIPTPGLNKVKFFKNLTIDVGGSGGGSGDGDDVLVTSGDRGTGDATTIMTQGDGSFGIFAQSIGAGGGIGGYGAVGELGRIGIGGAGGSAGNAGTVEINLFGNVLTSGTSAHAIFAQSIGGGGGVAGNVKRGIKNTGIGLAFGRAGGSAGDGDNVSITTEGTIQTTGDAASGIFAQSIGGGGGVAGDLGTGIGFAGSVGGDGNAGDVTIAHDGSVDTSGFGSDGVFAQSVSKDQVGKVEVTATSIATTGDEADGVDAQSIGHDGGAVNVTVGSIGTSGDDAVGVRALSKGNSGSSGAVSVSVQSALQTSGDRAHGIDAQSIGEVGGTVDIAVGSVSTPGALATTGDDAIGVRALSNGTVGSGGAVSAKIHGALQTGGDRAHGVLAQSIGTGAAAVSVTADSTISTVGAQAHGVFARSLGGGTGGPVTVTGSKEIIVAGLGSDAFRLEGDAGKALSLDIGSVDIQGGLGDGAAVRFIDGGPNTLTNLGNLSSLGATTIVGTTGDDAVINSGLVTGNIDLGGGINSFLNQAAGRLQSNAQIALGGGTLTNAGVLSPGGDGVVGTTNVGGNLVQTAAGLLNFDINFSSAASDLINVSGSAVLDGTLVVNLVQLDIASPVTIVTTGGGVTLAGLSIADTIVLDYELITQGNTLQLGFNFNFDVPGLDRNQQAASNYLDRVLKKGGDISFSPLLVALANITSQDEYLAAIEAINPEANIASLASFFELATQFPENLMSCRQAGGAYSPISEGQCYWARAERSSARQERGDNSVGYSEFATQFAGGLQVALDDNWRLGFGAGHRLSSVKSENRYWSDGRIYSGGLAVKYVSGPSMAAVAFSGGYGTYEGFRTLDFPVDGIIGTSAKSEMDTAYGAVRLRGAHVFAGQNIYLKPSVDVDLTYLNIISLQEIGAGVVSAKASDAAQTLVAITPNLELGARLKLSDTAEIRPYAGISVTFNPTTTLKLPVRFIGAQDDLAPFILKSTFDKISLGVSTGIDIVDDNFGALSFRYDGQFSDDRKAHSGSAKITLNF